MPRTGTDAISRGMKWRMSFLLLLTLLLPAGVYAADEAGVAISTATAATTIYPGLEEVVPKASQIDAESAKALVEISELKGQEAFLVQFVEVQKSWSDFQASLAEFGPQSEWPVNRLLNIRGQIDIQSRSLQLLLEKIGTPLKRLEDVRKVWSERLDYWEGWRSSLRDEGAKGPRQTFNKVRSVSTEVLDQCKNKSTELLQLQENVSRMREEVLALYEKLDADVLSLRKDPFKRSAHPLVSFDYLMQFNHALLAKTLDGIGAAFLFDYQFFRQHAWILVAQILLVIGLIIFFRKLEISTAEKTDDWQFIFQRPISAALFVSLAAPRLFYADLPPPLLQLFILFVATICAARLACQLLKEGNQRTLIYVLAGLFIISKILMTLAIPVPLFRFYLALVSLAGIPFLTSIIKRHRKHFRGRINHYLLILNGGKLVLLVSLLAQLSGFATFSVRLIDATIGTVFLMLFALMSLRITEGAIELFFRSAFVSTSRFVKNLGPDVTHRFARVCQLAISVISVLYLLELWGVFDSIGVAWLFFLGLEYRIGEFHLSVRMVLLVFAVVYVAMLISWFFQSFLESQVFHGKKIDRGVRDAFKTLSHYGFILAGFVVAMTMAGIELQNFAILAGAFGIGIGFGLQDVVNNFVSGLILLFERPVKVGDAVIIDGQWGAISRIGMRSTVVETWDRSELIVPNSQMISEKVLNWTLSSNVSRVTVSVGVRYGTDLEKVVKILNKIGDGHPSVVSDPAPSAIFTEFGDSSINFELRVWVDNIKNRLSLISDLGLAIDREFKKAKIEIPYPQRDLHLKTVAPEIKLSEPTGR